MFTYWHNLSHNCANNPKIYSLYTKYALTMHPC